MSKPQKTSRQFPMSRLGNSPKSSHYWSYPWPHRWTKQGSFIPNLLAISIDINWNTAKWNLGLVLDPYFCCSIWVWNGRWVDCWGVKMGPGNGLVRLAAERYTPVFSHSYGSYGKWPIQMMCLSKTNMFIWTVFKIPLSFRYTSWFIGIPPFSYYNPQYIG